MKLVLSNIGKISSAEIDINGITVIAGENNTGKSTVGKALFSVSNGFFNIKERIVQERIESIDNYLVLNLHKSSNNSFKRGYLGSRIFAYYTEFVKKLALETKNNEDSELIEKRLTELINQCCDNEIQPDDEEAVKDLIFYTINMFNIEDNRIIESILEKNLKSEFNGQICNIFSKDEQKGEIKLYLKDSCLSMNVDCDGNVKIDELEDLYFDAEAVYIDDPFIVDELVLFKQSENIKFNHRICLLEKLAQNNGNENILDEIIIKDKLSGIYKRLSSVCEGDISLNKNGEFSYRKKGNSKELSVKSLSTGLKTFVILKMLLENGNIKRNGIIILDEPEIHLHPEWQLVFAELIVLIQKEFHVHVLLNTHSPYFLNAIEIYASKYGIFDLCKFYLADVEDDVSNIEDVTDDIEKIYFKLARPLQDLENERGRLE